MTVSPQQFGEMVSDVKNIKEDMVEVKSDMKDMEGKVDRILTQIATVRGGMRVAVWFSGILGALGMFGLTKVAPMFIGFLPKI